MHTVYLKRKIIRLCTRSIQLVVASEELISRERERERERERVREREREKAREIENEKMKERATKTPATGPVILVDWQLSPLQVQVCPVGYTSQRRNYTKSNQ